MAFSPATGGDGSLVAGCVRSYVNLRDLGDPALRIPDSVVNSANWYRESYVNLRPFPDAMPRIPDSVCNVKN